MCLTKHAKNILKNMQTVLSIDIFTNNTFHFLCTVGSVNVIIVFILFYFCKIDNIHVQVSYKMDKDG